MIRRLIIGIHGRYLCRKWRLSRPSGRGLAKCFLEEYGARSAPVLRLWTAHRRGFPWKVWNALGLDRHSCSEYLSTAQYHGMDALNSGYDHWINDKLTVKYFCAGTALDRYMPAYYYQLAGDGRVLVLPDGTGRADMGAIVALLKEKGRLALKRVMGTCGQGFYRAEYDGGVFRLNGQALSEQELTRTLAGLRDYIVTEYLTPHPDLAAICPDTADTVRYLVGRVDGQMRMLKSYIRFGTRASGAVEGYGAGGVLCYVDENGRFASGNVIDRATGRNIAVDRHPGTGVPLQGTVPHWDGIVRAAEQYCEQFPQLGYLGFDFVVTDGGEVKLLEINSLTALQTLQLDGSILRSDPGRQFFAPFLRPPRGGGKSA